MDLLFENIRYYTITQLTNYFNTTELSILYNLKRYFDDIYYNCANPALGIFSDDNYDLLKEIIISRDKKYVSTIGIKTRDKEVVLPFFLPSMNKIKKQETTKFDRWFLKNPCKEYEIMDKLDGVSCLISVNSGIIRLYTRGDGKNGSDISHISIYLNLPDLTEVTDFNARGELIIKKEKFEKYKNQYANSRNMIIGLISSKTIKEGFLNNDIDLVLYEIVDNIKMSKISTQLTNLNILGFLVVENIIVNNLTIESITNILLERKNLSKYDIDGLIIQINKKYTRPDPVSGLNPKYAFAFKMNTTSVEATVINVEWNISKRGYLKPRIKIEPIHINGVTINYTTGFNARFIYNNKIGPGSIVSIIRSGDVIPYIVDIIRETTPEMPEINYEWNSTNIDIIIPSRVVEEGRENNILKEADIKLITYIFSNLNIKFVGISTVTKLYNANLNTFIKIISADKNRLLEIFPEKSATRIYNNIKNGLKTNSFIDILSASGIFGSCVGFKKVKLLLENIPNLFEIYKTLSTDEMIALIINIEGFSNITAIKIVYKLREAEKFLIELTPFITLVQTNDHLTVSLATKTCMNLKIVFSGFRNKQLEESIIANGGTILNSISKNTSVLVVKNNPNGEISCKLTKALNLGILVIEESEFITKYLRDPYP